MGEITSAFAWCTACGWNREITRPEAFNGDPVRSAKQAAKGHVSDGDCNYADMDVDAIEG